MCDVMYCNLLVQLFPFVQMPNDSTPYHAQNREQQPKNENCMFYIVCI